MSAAATKTNAIVLKRTKIPDTTPAAVPFENVDINKMTPLFEK